MQKRICPYEKVDASLVQRYELKPLYTPVVSPLSLIPHTHRKFLKGKWLPVSYKIGLKFDQCEVCSINEQGTQFLVPSNWVKIVHFFVIRD